MSRLTNPGPGEIIDRLSILALKILFGQQAGKDTLHWEKERSQLLPKVVLHIDGPTFELTLELAVVNAALWHAEDDLREARVEESVQTVRSWSKTGPLGVRLQELNDRRAELVHRINVQGGEMAGGEK